MTVPAGLVRDEPILDHNVRATPQLVRSSDNSIDVDVVSMLRVSSWLLNNHDMFAKLSPCLLGWQCRPCLHEHPNTFGNRFVARESNGRQGYTMVGSCAGLPRHLKAIAQADCCWDNRRMIKLPQL